MSLAKVVRSKKSITMDPQIETGARRIQAKLIEKTDKGWSVSIVLNILAAVGLTHSKKLSRDEWQKVLAMVEDKSVKVEDSAIFDIVRKLA